MIDYNIIATGSKGNAVVIDQKILMTAAFRSRRCRKYTGR